MGILALSPILAVHFPRILAFLPGILGLISLFWWRYIEKQSIVFSKNMFLSCALVCGIVLVSCAWSIDPNAALKKSFSITALITLGLLLGQFCLNIDRSRLRPYYWFLSLGVIFAALLCAFDLYFGLPIYNFTRDGAYETNLSVLNRGAVVIVFLFFSALLLNKVTDISVFRTRLLAAFMFLSVALMLSLGKGQSAQLAFLGGLIGMAVFPSRYSLSFRVLSFIVIGCLVLTPFIVQLLYAHFVLDIQHLEWFRKANAGHRIEIWHVVMQYALNQPYYGHGVEATRYVTDYRHDFVYQDESAILHPHNFSIQIWMEYGVIGIGLFSGLLFSIIESIREMNISKRPYVVALFFAVLIVASTGHGMWQSWWIGVVILVISLTTLITQERIEHPTSSTE